MTTFKQKAIEAFKKIAESVVSYLKSRCWHDWEHTHSFARYEALPGSKVFCETRAFTCSKCGSHDYKIFFV